MSFARNAIIINDDSEHLQRLEQTYGLNKKMTFPEMYKALAKN